MILGLKELMLAIVQLPIRVTHILSVHWKVTHIFAVVQCGITHIF